MKTLSEYLRATLDSPLMGLDNKICESPAYWCALHQVYLSEDDVIRKKCLCKPTFDMLGVNKCNSIRKVTQEEINQKLMQKQSKTKVPAKGSYDWKAAIGLTWD